MEPKEPQPSPKPDAEKARLVVDMVQAWLPRDEENGASASVWLKPKIEDGVVGIALYHEDPRKTDQSRPPDQWIPHAELAVDGIQTDEGHMVEPAKSVRVIDVNEGGDFKDLMLMVYPRNVQQRPTTRSAGMLRGLQALVHARRGGGEEFKTTWHKQKPPSV